MDLRSTYGAVQCGRQTDGIVRDGGGVLRVLYERTTRSDAGVCLQAGQHGKGYESNARTNERRT